MSQGLTVIELPYSLLVGRSIPVDAHSHGRIYQGSRQIVLVGFSSVVVCMDR